TAPFQQQDPRLDEASRLFEQALALRKDGKLREGVAAAEKAAALVEQVRGAEHLDTAGALMKLGALQFAVPNYAGAARTFERALSIYEKARPSDDPAVGEALNGLANAYCGLGEAPKALPLFERSHAPPMRSFDRAWRLPVPTMRARNQKTMACS